MTAPNMLINRGWTRTALKVGDKVTIFVNPLRNASRSKTAARAGCMSAPSCGRQEARANRRQGSGLEPLTDPATRPGAAGACLELRARA